jgi:hypothetical protein
MGSWRKIAISLIEEFWMPVTSRADGLGRKLTRLGIGEQT